MQLPSTYIESEKKITAERNWYHWVGRRGL